MYYYGINNPYYAPMQTAEALHKCYDFCDSLNNVNPNCPAEMAYLFLKADDLIKSCNKLPYEQGTLLTNLCARACLAKFSQFRL